MEAEVLFLICSITEKLVIRFYGQCFCKEKSLRYEQDGLTGLPGDPNFPGAPGGPISVRLLMGQPWEHLPRMEEAYWEI